MLIGIFFVFATPPTGSSSANVPSTWSRCFAATETKELRDTWDLIDLKLGAFVRGQALLILLVGTVLSLAFWAIGLPYLILVGAFAGLVEIVPVIGPLAAGALAVGVGLTDSVAARALRPAIACSRCAWSRTT